MFAYCNNSPASHADASGNWTFSVSLGLSAVFFLGISVNLSFAWDDTGGFDIQWSYSFLGKNDTSTLGIIGVGGGVTFQVTDAEKVDDLLGNSYALGGSVGALPYVGADLVSNSPINESKSRVNGVQVSVGVGLGFDVHVTQSYTSSLRKSFVREASVQERKKAYSQAKEERLLRQANLI